MQGKVEVQVKPITIHPSALTWTLACSSLLARAVLEDLLSILIGEVLRVKPKGS